jgi:hypothetical protein
MRTPRRAFLWVFRNRTSGRITVVQWPNLPLAAWLLATVIQLAFRSSSAVSAVAAALGSAALAVWALAEIAWGVNPFRRSVGSAVLIALVVSALRHIG